MKKGGLVHGRKYCCHIVNMIVIFRYDQAGTKGTKCYNQCYFRVIFVHLRYRLIKKEKK